MDDPFFRSSGENGSASRKRKRTAPAASDRARKKRDKDAEPANVFEDLDDDDNARCAGLLVLLCLHLLCLLPSC